jgi:hypothetical protein
MGGAPSRSKALWASSSRAYVDRSRIKIAHHYRPQDKNKVEEKKSKREEEEVEANGQQHDHPGAAGGRTRWGEDSWMLLPGEAVPVAAVSWMLLPDNEAAAANGATVMVLAVEDAVAYWMRWRGDGEAAQLVVAAAVEVSWTPLLVVATVHLEVVCWPLLRLAEAETEISPFVDCWVVEHMGNGSTGVLHMGNGLDWGTAWILSNHNGSS